MSLGLENVRVLLADDNPNMRAIVTMILQGIGIRSVAQAQDGSQALELLRGRTVDLAIVDFRMAPMDGADFTRLIRNADDSPNPYLPIIMMTGFADRARVVEARDAGVTEFVVKPVTARSIIDRIEAVILRPRAFVRTEDYFGPLRRGLDDAVEPPKRALAI